MTLRELINKISPYRHIHFPQSLGDLEVINAEYFWENNNAKLSPAESEYSWDLYNAERFSAVKCFSEDDLRSYLNNNFFSHDIDAVLSGIFEGIKHNYELEDFFLFFDVNERNKLFITSDLYAWLY